MDNRPADWLIGPQHRIEELSHVLRSFGIDAKLLGVRAFIRFAARDNDDPVSLCLDQRRKLFSDADPVGKDKPIGRAGWRGRLRGRLFVRTLFWLPLEFVEPVVNILIGGALGIAADAIEAQSDNFGCHLPIFIQEPHVSLDAVGAGLLQMGVTP
jgi:hypothetical protein